MSSIYVSLSVTISVAHNNNFRDRPLVARLNTRLMRLLDEHPDDLRVADMVVIVTSHTTSCIMRSLGNRREHSYDDLAMEQVVLVALKTLRSSNSHPSAVSHALTTAFVALEYATEKCSSIPGLVNLLVALTRSKRMSTRGLALGSLGCLVDSKVNEAVKAFDEARNLASSSGPHGGDQNEVESPFLTADTPEDDSDLPEDITRILGRFNLSDLEKTIQLRCNRELRDFLAKRLPDNDYERMADPDRRALGHMLVKFILTIGHPSPAYRKSLSEKDKEAHLMLVYLGMDALRQRPKGRADRDAGDVLALYFKTLNCCRCGHNRERELAQQVLARSPGLAYAHFLDAATYAPSAAGRSAARRGLECAGVSRWLRGELLMRSVAHTFTLVRDVFWQGNEGRFDGPARDLAGALVVSALRDVDAFIAEAPPDASPLQAALEYKLILTLTLQGDAIDAQLVEVRVGSVSTDLSTSR